MDELKMFDIVFVKITDKIGSEQSGIHPYVVIQNNIGNKYCPTFLGMSLTSSLKKEELPTHCVIHKTNKNGLKHDSMLLGETLTQISKDRIISKLGYIDNVNEQNEVINIYFANITGIKTYNNYWNSLLCQIIKFIKQRNKRCVTAA